MCACVCPWQSSESPPVPPNRILSARVPQQRASLQLMRAAYARKHLFTGHYIHKTKRPRVFFPAARGTLSGAVELTRSVCVNANVFDHIQMNYEEIRY